MMRLLRSRRMLVEGLQSRQMLAADLQLVKDINTESDFVSVSLYARPVQLLNGVGFVSKPSEEDGIELWRTDGTVEGTGLLKDIAPGPDSSSPSDMVVSGDSLYFLAQESPMTNPFGYSLWMSKGTAETTERVSIETEADFGLLSSPRWLTSTDNGLFFVAEDVSGKVKLWQAVGNQATEVQVEGLVGVLEGTYGFSQVNNRLMFTGAGVDGSVGLYSLDTSTLTAERLSDAIYFEAVKSDDGDKLWILATNIDATQSVLITDGTVAGTVAIENATEWAWPSFSGLQSVNDRVVALSTQLTTGLQQLVSVDEQGNIEVLETFEDMFVSFLISPAVDGRILLSPQDLMGPAYLTGGTVESTVLLEGDDLPKTLWAHLGVAWNSKLVVPGYREGTEELISIDMATGNAEIIDSGSGLYGIPRYHNLTATNDGLYWLDANSDQLMRTRDGVTVELVADGVGMSGPIADLGQHSVMIGADDRGLFIGSVEGDTFQPLSPVHELGNLTGVFQNKAAEWNDQVFLFAYVNDRIELWRTDGTESGTISLSDNAFGAHAMIVPVEDGVAVIDNEGLPSASLWFSDGTAENTRQVADVNSRIDWAVGLGDSLVTSSLNEVVRWDLATGDSQLIKNFQSETKSYVVTQHVVQNDRVYIPVIEVEVLEDGSLSTTSGIWGSDGTAAGTELVTNDDSIVKGWERAKVLGDAIYVMVEDNLFVTRDGFRTSELLIEANSRITDVALGDGTVYTIRNTNDFSTGIYRLDVASGDEMLIGRAGYIGVNFFETRFMTIDSELYVWGNDQLTSDLLVQRIDDKTGAMSDVPALSEFRYGFSWAPVALSRGVIGQTVQENIGQELFLLPSDDIQALDLSGPKRILTDSPVVPENVEVDSEIGVLITEADRPGFYRYQLVDGQEPNDNDSFEIVGDRLVTKIAFDRDVQSEYTIEVKSTSLSGASLTSRLTLIIGDPVVPPEAQDDWGSVRANDTIIVDLMSNDVEGSLGMEGAWIEMLTMPENGTIEIGSDGKIHFKPNENFVGIETIEYVIFDSMEFASEPAIVTFEVLSRFFNQAKPTDVSMDGRVSPVDALQVINHLNRFGINKLDQSSVGEDSTMIDVSGDGWSNPIDVLMVINHLNRFGMGNGEGEADESFDETVDAIASERANAETAQQAAAAAFVAQASDWTGESFDSNTRRRRR